MALIVFMLSFVAVTANAGRPVVLETAIEGVHAFYLGKDLHGYVKTRDCKDCKEYMVKISPQDEAFLDGKPVPLENFVMSNHLPSVIHINKKTKRLRIIWYSK